jgi:hypothetical protein
MDSLSRRKAESCAKWAILLFLICQFTWIPVIASEKIPWALWPTPADIVWLLTLYTAVWHRENVAKSSAGDKLNSCIKAFGGYVAATYALACIRFGLEVSQLGYFAWNCLRALQAYTLFQVARRVREEATPWCALVGILAASLGAGAAIAQSAELVKYSDLVAHLPKNLRIAGPWGWVVNGKPGEVLGSFNYNHITGGHFIASALLISFGCFKNRLVAWLLIFELGIGLVTLQSGTSLLTLAAGAAVLGVLQGARKPIGTLMLLVTAGTILWLYAGAGKGPGERLFGLIQSRPEPVSRQLSLRWERNLVGIDVGLSNATTLLVGVGWGNLRHVSTTNAAHGLPYTALAELGALGILGLGAIYYSAWRAVGWRTPFSRSMRGILGGCLATSPLNDLLLPNPAGYPFFLILWCLIGLAAGQASLDSVLNGPENRCESAELRGKSDPTKLDCQVV